MLFETATCRSVAAVLFIANVSGAFHSISIEITIVLAWLKEAHFIAADRQDLIYSRLFPIVFGLDLLVPVGERRRIFYRVVYTRFASSSISGH